MTIGEGVSCWKCAYNLRGLKPTQCCPECGEANIVSITGMRVDGKYLVVRDGARLPKRCIKTNVPVDGDFEQKSIYYCPVWVYILILLNVLIMAVAYLVMRKRCTLNFFLSREIKQKRRKQFWIIGLVLIGLIIGLIAPFAFNAPEDVAAVIATVSGIGLVIAILVAVYVSNLVTAAKHKKGWFWITGINKDLLAQIEADHALMTDDPAQRSSQLPPGPPSDPAAPSPRAI